MAEQAEQMVLEQENQRALNELREKLCREKELVRSSGLQIQNAPLHPSQVLGNKKKPPGARLELPGDSAPMGHVGRVKTVTLQGLKRGNLSWKMCP